MMFNRPQLTRLVIDAISTVRPKKLYVIADGPRPERSEDQSNCSACQRLIERIDWNCTIEKNYAETNLGCCERHKSGLDWVFEREGRAIILEDDCIPNPSFFRYCEALLEKYDDDQRIMHISGMSVFSDVVPHEYSYYFTKSLSCWGWATWARAWKYFDVSMQSWPDVKKAQILLDAYILPPVAEYFGRTFDRLYGQRDSNEKDYYWIYACISQCGLGIRPYENLVSNIGFGADALHSELMQRYKDHINNRTTEMKFPISHPTFVARDRSADLFTFEHWWNDVRKPMEKLQKHNKFYRRAKRVARRVLCRSGR